MNEVSFDSLIGGKMDIALLIAIVIVAGAAFLIFFRGKGDGFGPFNTSILLILTVTTLTALLLVGQHIEGALFGHVVFGILGFAGGLFIPKS